MLKEKQIYIIFILSFIAIIIFSFYSNFKYIIDSFISIILITFLFYFYKELYLNKFLFSLLFFSILLHNLGVFGFYNISPFFFQYDYLTHFAGGFSLSLFFLNYLRKISVGENRFIVLIISLLATLGIGSIIEICEFIGYILLGEGEGFLFFGGAGDLGINNLFEKDKFFGAWVNASIDMIFNFVGWLLGIFIYFIYKKFK